MEKDNSRDERGRFIKGHTASENNKLMSSLANKGKKHSDSEIKKMKEGMKKFYSNEDNRKEFKKKHDEAQFKRRKITATREELVDLYWNKNLSLRQIARLFNVKYNAVYDRFLRENIPKRSSEDGSKLNPVHLSEETKKIISKSAREHRKKDWENPEYRKKMEESLSESRAKITPESLKKISESQSLNWKNPEFSKVMFKALAIKPNRPETIILNFLISINAPFVYNRGEFNIGGKIPDFIDEKDKKIIEMHGRAFHDPNFKSSFSKNIPFHRTIEGTIEHYNKNGYSCLVIWDSDLSNEETFSRIQQFCV